MMIGPLKYFSYLSYQHLMHDYMMAHVVNASCNDIKNNTNGFKIGLLHINAN